MAKKLSFAKASRVLAAGLMPKPAPVLHKYKAYIPEDGHWPIRGLHKNATAARAQLRETFGVKRLPAGTYVDRDDA